MALGRDPAGTARSLVTMDLLVAAAIRGRNGRIILLHRSDRYTRSRSQPWTHSLIGSSGPGRLGTGALSFAYSSFISLVLTTDWSID